MIETRAFSRAGLLGNPSDGYYGKTISISVKNFGAHVTLVESPDLHIEPQEGDINSYPNIQTFIEQINILGYYGGIRLIKAAIKTFYDYCQNNHISLTNKNFTIRYSSNIPRQIGLAGSSAIITATMRALMQYYEVEIPLEILPTLILNVEVKELGINAGLQDRVIQVYEGCVYMDFEKEYLQKNQHGIYETLDAHWLKDHIYIAYKTELGKISGIVLNDIRVRFDRGDMEVINTLKEIGELAKQGQILIKNRNLSELNELINLNFDLRRHIMKISNENIQMVEEARNSGVSAKFSGSGGSIIGLYENNAALERLITAMRKINARVIKPLLY
jgi:glucuronokinase